MNNQIRLFVLILLLFTATNLLKAQSTPTEISKEFFKIYEKSPEESFSILMRDQSTLDKHVGEDLKNQFLVSLAEQGTYFGYEEILEKTLGDSLILQSYLMKFELHPVRLTIVFYRPKDKWRILDFQFDSNDLITELKNIGKVN